MLKNIRFHFVLFLILLGVFGCGPKPVPKEPVDKYGCQPPPADVFTSTGVDLKFAQSTFGKIVTGDIDLKIKPEVITLASKAVIDDRIRNYLRCLSIHRDGYTPEQAAFFDELANFMSTSPTTEQFLSWKEKNQFPVGKKTASESINASLPEGLSLRYAITRLAQLDNFTVDFKSSCTKTLLDLEVEKSKLTARSSLKLIQLLPMHLKEQTNKITLQVTKNENGGKYEIQCVK